MTFLPIVQRELRVAARRKGTYRIRSWTAIIAISLLLGGVTGGEFWRRALALINALVVSLAAGIWVSVFARDSQRAMGRAFALILFLTAVLPAVAALGSALSLSPVISLLRW